MFVTNVGPRIVPWLQKGANMNIFAGNLSREFTETDLRHEFEAFGQVTSVKVVKDKFSGQSKGYGFVEMASVSEGQAAIRVLNGKTLNDRTLTINEARPRPDNRGGGAYGGGRSGGFGLGSRRRY